MTRSISVDPRIGFILLLAACVTAFAAGPAFAQLADWQDNPVEQPITVNGDTVEYSPENKVVTATGNVRVEYKQTKLSCDKLTVNTQTKDAVAEGHVRIDDKMGLMVGEKIIYNFNTKVGTVIEGAFMSDPYYGKGKKLERISENEFVALNGYASSCNFDNPQYRIKAKQVKVYPKDKIKTKSDTVYIGGMPVAWLPFYNQSLKDRAMTVQLTPGYRKKWGAYLLSSTRWRLTDDLTFRTYLDYRNRLGWGEGFGANYKTDNFGTGDLKFYYTNETDTEQPQGQPDQFERYMTRWRHKWNIDDRTNIYNEYYFIRDPKHDLLDPKGQNPPENSFLKDYFYREYDEDLQPLSYSTFHHSFNYSSFDLLLQKRTNRWYDQVEKLPEAKFSMASKQIGESPFYFDDSSSAGNYNKKSAVPADSSTDVNMLRFDTTNKIIMPMRLAFINASPFVGLRNTVYDKDVNNGAMADSPRTMFMTGVDMSTKFYRLFDVNSNFLGMDINGLRHIITPSVGYAYNHRPTIAASKLKQIDSVDALDGSNSATLSLDNKFQTKRDGKSVDFADFKIDSLYTYKPHDQSGSSYGDTIFNLEIRPYSWVTFDSDATYTHTGARDSDNYNRFSNANYDWTFNIAPERTVSLGQRYQRKGGDEVTFNTDWRLTPKWKVGMYHRYQFSRGSTLTRGFYEHEYRIIRDLHCWDLNIIWNQERGQGTSIWFVFNLKAFPETAISIDHSYNKPKGGSQ